MAPAPYVLTTLLAAVIVASASTAEGAARLRYRGRVASDQGGFVRITATLRPVTADTYAGTLRCRRGPVLRCISPRGGMTLRATPEGFEAVLTFINGMRCVAVGSGTPGSALVGEYGCELRGTVADSGVFQLTRRR